MSAHSKVIVMGANGVIGSNISRFFEEKLGFEVIRLTRDNYSCYIGEKGSIFINCNGNGKRFLAEKDPLYDFQASVSSVMNSLFDFKFDKYIYISTVDVYDDVSSFNKTKEDNITLSSPSHYGFHKILAEQLVNRYSMNNYILRLGTVVDNNLKKNPIFDLLHNIPMRIDPNSQLNLVSSHFINEYLKKIIVDEVPPGTYNVVARKALSPLQAAKILKRSVNCIKTPTQKYIYNINYKKTSQYMTPPTSEETLIKTFLT